MPSTTKYNLPYPSLSNVPNVPADLQALAEAIADIIATDAQGVLSDRPNSSGGSPGVEGRYYMVKGDADPSQNGILYRDNGAGWDPVGNIGTGAVTTAKLAAGAVTLAKVGSDVPIIPIGAVMDWPWAHGLIPAWSGLAYGQAVSRATYTSLFSVANGTGLTVYGAGNGTDTFNLPDLRGRVLAGRDDMGGTAANRITIAVSGIDGTILGAVVGSQGVTLTTAQIPAHNHGINDPGHAHGYTAPNGGLSAPGGGLSAPVPVDATTTTVATNITINNAGGGGSHQNMQPTVVVNKIMRLL